MWESCCDRHPFIRLNEELFRSVPPSITIEAPPLSNIDRDLGLEAPDGINETSVRNRVSKKQQLLKGTSQMRERSSFGSAGATGASIR
jgi:hypothetical protein